MGDLAGLAYSKMSNVGEDLTSKAKYKDSAPKFGSEENMFNSHFKMRINAE